MTIENKSRTDVLHEISRTLTERSVRAQINVATDTLSFFESMDNEAIGEEKAKLIKKQKDLIAVLNSNDYFNQYCNIVAESFDYLSDEHLKDYARNLAYEEALVSVHTTLLPALQVLQDNLMAGFVEKPTLQ